MDSVYLEINLDLFLTGMQLMTLGSIKCKVNPSFNQEIRLETKKTKTAYAYSFEFFVGDTLIALSVESAVNHLSGKNHRSLQDSKTKRLLLTERQAPKER